MSLDALWSVLEVGLEGPGASWRRLGSVLGYLGGVLGVLPISKRSEAARKTPWERLWGVLGSSCARLGDVLEASQGVLGVFFSVFETYLKRIARKLDF